MGATKRSNQLRRWPWGQRELARIAALKALIESERKNKAISAEHSELLDQADYRLTAAQQYIDKTWIPFRSAAVDGALANTNEAHTLLLRAISPTKVQGMLADLVDLIEKYLSEKNHLRVEVQKILDTQTKERIEHEQNRSGGRYQPSLDEQEKQTIVDAVARAYNAQEYDIVTLRSFERLVYWWSAGLACLVLLVTLATFYRPELFPLCFYPTHDADASSIALPDNFTGKKVVCPTRESFYQNIDPQKPLMWPQEISPKPWSQWDYVVIVMAGIVAAAVTGAATLHRLKDSGSANNIPSALAVLKLPAGALTAILGILLMRGEFVPGLSALDTSAQIIAWAVVFGAAQQLFTRLVDHQGASIMELDPTPEPPPSQRERRAPQPKPPGDRGGSPA